MDNTLQIGMNYFSKEERKKAIVRLRFEEARTQEEIAKTLNISQQAVAKILAIQLSCNPNNDGKDQRRELSEANKLSILRDSFDFSSQNLNKNYDYYDA